MTSHQPEFWFRGDYDLLTDESTQRGLSDTYERAAKALHQFDRDKQPYGVTIELVEHLSNKNASLAEFCQQLIETLAAPRKASGGRPCKLDWLTRVHGTMRFVGHDMGSRLTLQRDPDASVHVAGTLLIDARQTISSEDMASPRALIDAIKVFPQHPLARAGAEYAAAIDFPLPLGYAGRDGVLKNGLLLIHQIIVRLPTTPEQRSTLTEFWVNCPSDDEQELVVRLRIWRLGVMQVAPTTRRA